MPAGFLCPDVPSTAHNQPKPKGLRENRTLCAEIVRADFDGDHLLDPTTNQALRYIHAADEAIATYPQGAFPLIFARDAAVSTAELLAKCRARYGVPIVKPMEHAFNRW